MKVRVENVSRVVDDETWLDDIDLTLEPGRLHVLLGRTLAGKTSLLRVLAGLEPPTSGRVTMDGVDVASIALQRRGIAFVYEQFVNYPSFTVAENIAAPLRRAGLPAAERYERVRRVAGQLHIDHLLDRLPAELSGGQQQRVAIARALAKDAALLLLDEPLVNLDYKLREELRSELRALLAGSDRIVVYTTTDPQEAVQMDGDIAVLHEGRLLQCGPAASVYARPANTRVAQLLSDPAMNIVPARIGDGLLKIAGVSLPLPEHLAASGHRGDCRIGVRPTHMRYSVPGTTPADDGLAPPPGRPSVDGEVTLAEVNGSETYVHARSGDDHWILHLDSIHRLPSGTRIALHPDPQRLYLYGADGALLATPPASRRSMEML